MTRSFPFIAALVFAAFCLAFQVKAQSTNLQYQVANIMEDQRLMMEQMRGLLAEMDEMRRENARLRALVEDFEAKAARQSGSYATVAQVNELVRKTAADLSARDEVIQRELTAMVNRELKKFAKDVQDAVATVPTVSKPDPNVKTDFPDNYPKTGIPYDVAPGDSLAGIAKKLNSRVDWIQNANKISDPRLLQVGQKIFIPQASE
ncbi:LysM peptidoglycan-binding domain-containing protein [Pelagicoccus sp. NFK12]|uniref:LysM peptidoglycan-binding domain-containing protein n=1 Tax=Pelagicoccus enzymogenes TaxID=2773457 RepID=A0A927FEM8_9BACT|nr:LysM peptidoglycan-binding domain-containing protein [Pelagicoccus enzymogenes]MBD5781998.1 LysM peptidoglycan-binding domain-containing protein [Pelagicoccus enzymogenes]MDQ8196753.1 LysM peptidoglycan-binding domain-containing protein [Pelagicoccus enzymogenes]